MAISLTDIPFLAFSNNLLARKSDMVPGLIRPWNGCSGVGAVGGVV